MGSRACSCGPARDSAPRRFKGALLTTVLEAGGFSPTKRLKFALGPRMYTELEKRLLVGAGAAPSTQDSRVSASTQNKARSRMRTPSRPPPTKAESMWESTTTPRLVQEEVIQHTVY
jgi:hypothetical protein